MRPVRHGVRASACCYASCTSSSAVVPRSQRRQLRTGSSRQARRSVTTRAQAPLVDLDEMAQWILHETDDLLVFNKPGWLVCHPSKNGPLSSLVGAAREYTGLEKLHLVARLDRETSGLVVCAKHPLAARRYQMAIQERIVKKVYLAILEGDLTEPIEVDQPIARRESGGGPVHVKHEVLSNHEGTGSGAQAAVTRFIPLAAGGGYTLARVEPQTGRQHQIRVHAEWLDHRVVGDKIYGPDETLYLEFGEHGWTARLEACLPLKRQALHCYEYTFEFDDGDGGAETYTAPLAAELRAFCTKVMGLDWSATSSRELII